MNQRIAEQKQDGARRLHELRQRSILTGRLQHKFALALLDQNKNLEAKRTVQQKEMASRLSHEVEPTPDENNQQIDTHCDKDWAPPSSEKKKHEFRGFTSREESDFFLERAATVATLEARSDVSTLNVRTGSLPRVFIKEIVEKIIKTTNSLGQKSISIDLKPHVLAGARIEVSVNKGSVRLHFATNDSQARRLLKDSESTISDLLSEKSLLLSDFIVS